MRKGDISKCVEEAVRGACSTRPSRRFELATPTSPPRTCWRRSMTPAPACGPQARRLAPEHADRPPRLRRGGRAVSSPVTDAISRALVPMRASPSLRQERWPGCWRVAVAEDRVPKAGIERCSAVLPRCPPGIVHFDSGRPVVEVR
jgi:hypothetical protein